MKMPKLAVLAVALLPLMAIAQEHPAPQSLVVPGVMTTSGHRFATHCTDAGFARARNDAALARRCLKLLARWQAEADLVLARRANPRIRDVATLAHTGRAELPFDTVATLRSLPLQYSYGR